MASVDEQASPDGPISVPAGTVIFEEDTKGRMMFVIVKGEVEISLRGTQIGMAAAGEVIGEMALLKSATRSATATARTDCVLDPVDKQRFEKLIQRSPSFALYVMNVLADRIRQSNEILAP